MTQYQKDLNNLIGYILEHEYEDFLDCLSENGAEVLTDEEVNTLLTDSDESTNPLVEKECASTEQDHIYAIAWRLMAKG